MNYGYSQQVYRPVMRNPCLFHQNNIRPTPSNYSPHPAASSGIKAYSPTLYHRQSSYTVQSPLPYSPHSYANYPNLSRYPVPSSLPYTSYTMPAFSYAPTASSKGVSIVLIATLILVALDLVIVRPQKSKSAVQSLKSAEPLS